MPKLKCKNCRKVIYKKPSRIYTSNFCSRTCKHQTLLMEKTKQKIRTARAKQVNLGNEKKKGKHYSLRTEFHKGQESWNKGLKIYTGGGVKKGQFTGDKNPFYGKHHSEETKRKWKDWFYKTYKKENHYNWQGGKSFEPYGIAFNKTLKDRIRTRDNHVCQECGFTQEQLGYKLHIHHIDYNKKNNNLNNLISLCRNCHMQTNFNRKNWEEYFQKKLHV